MVVVTSEPPTRRSPVSSRVGDRRPNFLHPEGCVVGGVVDRRERDLRPARAARVCGVRGVLRRWAGRATRRGAGARVARA